MISKSILRLAAMIFSGAVCVGGLGAQDEDTTNNIGAVLNFEAPVVHPITIAAGGTRLLAVDTPDARLSVFDLAAPSNPVLLKEIPVGIEPVSVRARTTDEAWVVNHTSDSISVVSLSQGVVTDTIYCKDEPCDVVFAGSPQRAYVSIAGLSQVRVFDVSTHALISTIPILGMQPRALAVSNDGSKVYAAITMSGNRTTVAPKSLAPPQPNPTKPGVGAPPGTALIVNSTDPTWAQTLGYSVADNDVAEITTATNTVSRYFSGVGTVNFNLAVHPTTGNLYVANTDSRNIIRFESALRGHAVDNQISKIDIVSSSVTKTDLNPGISYANPNNPAAKALALAQPTDVVFTPGGSFMYVASFGTDRIAKLDASGNIVARIEVGTAVGSAADPRHKKGPRALAVHPTAGRMYSLNRISNTITVINTTNDTLGIELAVGGFDPTPQAVRDGRGFLYDAKLSGNGTMACAACHIDGDTDREDWDLGDPDGPEGEVPDPSNTYGVIPMHPEKGPMFTQTLRGLSSGSNPLHWRGDRNDFNAFNTAFSSLMGGTQLPAADMQAFTDFIMTADFEPNPNLNLDRTLPATLAGGNPTNGKNIYKVTSASTPQGACNDCHHLPLGTGSKIVNKTVLGQAQGLKVPQLRTAYQKTGFFNNAPGATSTSGFGFTHDGTFPSIESFLTNNPTPFGALATNPADQKDLAAFIQCIDTNTAPAVGYSRTVTASNANSASITSDFNLLISRVVAGEIDLIVKGRTDGALHGFLYVPSLGQFQTDQGNYGPFTWAQLKTKVQAGGILTFMGVPKGSGQRMGIDRNMNLIPDADEATITALENFGHPTPACAGDIHLAANMLPYIGATNFAFTCTNIAPNAKSLLLAGGGPGIEEPIDLVGVSVWVDIAQPEVYAIDIYADDLGFGYLTLPLPNNPALVGLTYSAMVITLNACAPYGVAGSQGVRFDLNDAPANGG